MPFASRARFTVYMTALLPEIYYFARSESYTWILAIRKTPDFYWECLHSTRGLPWRRVGRKGYLSFEMLFILFRTNYTTVFNFHSTLVYLTKHEILQPDPLASKSVSFKPHGSFIHKGNSACLDDAELLSWWEDFLGT